VNEKRPLSEAEREDFAAFVLRMRGIGLDDKPLMAAFESVPRRGFVDAEYHHVAMGAGTIPIPCGEALEGIDLQARILHALQLDGTQRVLEIGTGTGYSASVISRLAKRVHTIERYRTLHASAVQRMRHLGLTNVIADHADGSSGSTDGPFERIVCWATFETTPRNFVEQLNSGGIMICAIGEADQAQTLVRMSKVGSRFEREDIGTVRFQPIAHGVPSIL